MGNSLSSEQDEKLAKLSEDFTEVIKLLEKTWEKEDREKADRERELAAYRLMHKNRGNHILKPDIRFHPIQLQLSAIAISRGSYKECPICLTNRKDLAFGCGHLTCEECGSKVSNCPVCRVQITSRLRIYNG